MKLIETKGDIRFYKDENGRQFQKIQNGEAFRVKDGKIAYKEIKQVNGYTIKYNTNGVYGFGIFRGKTLLEDRIWTLEKAEESAQSM